MQIQEQLQIRKEKGYEIAKTKKIVMEGHKWIVPSQNSINKKYEVTLYLNRQVCTCPDFTGRGLKCKHIFAVQITIEKEIDGSGNVSITHTKRITYKQDWPNYDKAQTQQKELFMKLLFDLCGTIQEEQQVGRGRPRLAIQDVLFSSALKVFTTFSLRRFTTDMKLAGQLGYIKKTPHFSMVSYYMEKAEITPIIKEMITLSAMPLKSVETDFAIDSTGFRTTKFNDYCREKHHIEKQHLWVKTHLCCGVKTNIVTAVEIDSGHDTLQFIPLATKTHDIGFTIKEVSGDKAYNSKANYTAIAEFGGTAYIPFKSNTSPWGNSSSKGNQAKTWRKMYRFFTYNQDEFLEHYHKRSNAESTNNMIKSKFTDLVRSKNKTAQINEVLLKVLCHNICVLIQEMFELGIEPDFVG